MVCIFLGVLVNLNQLNQMYLMNDLSINQILFMYFLSYK